MNQINVDDINKKELNCKGCANKCTVLRFDFPNGNTAYAGNKCEKVFFSKNSAKSKGYNAFEVKNNILFHLPYDYLVQKRMGTKIKDKKLTEKYTNVFSSWNWSGDEMTIGIPRALNMYENFPFWKTLLEGCGIKIVLSPESNVNIFQKGVENVMSDNICFPAKLTQGHILSLIETKVTRILYPLVPKEAKDFKDANNSFNCPVVSGYPDVIRSSIEPLDNYGVILDLPVMNFANEKALKRQCIQYLETLISFCEIETVEYSLSEGQKKYFDEIFDDAIYVRNHWKDEFIANQKNILENCIQNGELCFVVAGRPYHTDPLVNQKVGQILSDLGVHVLTEDVFLQTTNNGFKRLNLISQWSYPNRVVQAAIEVAKLPQNIQLIQLNSFGCGPDSFFMDEIGDILHHSGKNHTVLRIDEIASPGSIRLRCRSLIESLKTMTI